MEYFAPEVWRPRDRCEEGKADVWALGVILYQLLTDRLPFTVGSDTAGSDAALKALERAACHKRPPAPPTPDRLSAALSDICTRCLQKSPRNRPMAREVAELVGEALRQNADANGGSTQTRSTPGAARGPTDEYVRKVRERLRTEWQWRWHRGYTGLKANVVHAVSSVEKNPASVALDFLADLRDAAQTLVSSPPDDQPPSADKLAFDVLAALSGRQVKCSAEERARAEDIFDFWWKREDFAVAEFLFRLYRLGDVEKKRRLDGCFAELQRSEKSVPLAKFIRASGPERRRAANPTVDRLLAEKKYAELLQFVQEANLVREYPLRGWVTRFLRERRCKDAAHAFKLLEGRDQNTQLARAILQGLYSGRNPQAAGDFKLWCDEQKLLQPMFAAICARP